jgi:hypothetical protein
MIILTSIKPWKKYIMIDCFQYNLTSNIQNCLYENSPQIMINYTILNPYFWILAGLIYAIWLMRFSK